MIQWMPLEEVAEDLRTIVRTFMGVFPHAYLFVAHDSSFLVGMEEPLALDPSGMQRELDAPAAANLRRYGWRDAGEVLSLLVADSTSAAAWLGQEDTINSLEHPVLEFYSPGALATPGAVRRAENAAAFLETREEALRGIRLTAENPSTLQRSARAVGDVLSALVALGSGDPGREDDARKLLDSAAAAALPTTTLSINGHKLTAEVAATPDQRATGLMNRFSLRPDSGMLFVFERAEPLV